MRLLNIKLEANEVKEMLHVKAYFNEKRDSSFTVNVPYKRLHKAFNCPSEDPEEELLGLHTKPFIIEQEICQYIKKCIQIGEVDSEMKMGNQTPSMSA